MTFFVVISYVVMVSFKWIEFFGETDSIEYLSEPRQDMNERIDFQSLGFSFAIDNLEPRFGKIEATQVSWSGTNSAERKEQPIDLKFCDALEPQNLQLTNEYSQARSQDPRTYLCPDLNSESASYLYIEGGFYEEFFSYIKLSVRQCQ